MNHVKLLSVAVMVAASFALASCGTPANPPPNATPQQVVTLPQAQKAAAILYQNLKANVAVYEQNAAPDPQTLTDLNQAMADLGIAVGNFTALPPDANYYQAANAVLNVALGVVTNLPAGVLSPNAKAAIDAGISTVQAVLALLPTPSAPVTIPTAQATGPL